MVVSTAKSDLVAKKEEKNFRPKAIRDSFFRGGPSVRALKKHSAGNFNLLVLKGLFPKSVFSPG
jgi:hypothetical protein